MSEPKMSKFFSYICKTFDKYQKELNLQNYRLNIERVEEESETGAGMRTGLTLDGYTKIHVTIYEDAHIMWQDKDFKGIELMILHELSHVLICDLTQQAHDRYSSEASIRFQEERLCENLSVIMHKILSKKNTK